MKQKKLYGTATVGTKGQVVIPADAREELGICPGDRLYVVGSPHGEYIGFIKEEPLRQMIDHTTEQADELKGLLVVENRKDIS